MLNLGTRVVVVVVEELRGPSTPRVLEASIKRSEIFVFDLCVLYYNIYKLLYIVMKQLLRLE